MHAAILYAAVELHSNNHKRKNVYNRNANTYGVHCDCDRLIAVGTRWHAIARVHVHCDTGDSNEADRSSKGKEER